MTSQTISVEVPCSIRRQSGRKTIITPDGSASAAVSVLPRRADPDMVKALARAYRWRRLLDAGLYSSISEIALKEKIDRGYLGSILRLTMLAPDIVEAIFDGSHAELGLTQLLRPFPLEWKE